MSHDPTMFWILKSVNLALNPSFWIIRAYFRDASFESSSDFAPVTTILPDAKIRAVVLGSRMRMITAAKRCFRQQTLVLHSQTTNNLYFTCVCEKSKQATSPAPTFGLYSAFLAWRAMVLRSSRQSRLTVATMFLQNDNSCFSILVGQKGKNHKGRRWV